MVMSRSAKINCLICMILLAICVAAPAEARLQGEAEIGYVDYDSTVQGRQRDGSTFQHRYALLYSNKGLLEHGRLGRYQYALGYEWASFRTRLVTDGTDETLSTSAGHLLFNGALQLKPSRLPLRFDAYSQDLSRSAFQDTGAFLQNDIMNPGITTSLLNGTHIRSGATLVYGLAQDMTHPLYRELPRFMIDYKDSYDSDLKNITPMDTRAKQFNVTLTKGDVEVGFFRYDFSDKINGISSFIDDRITIGTTTYREGRKWVDITNWIKVSTDASFIRHRGGDVNEAGDDYDLNLQAMATREKWNVMTFNNFLRSQRADGISYDMTIPVYAKGVWNTDTDWQIRLLADNEKKEGLRVSPEDNRTDLLASLKIHTFKRSEFTLSPSLSVEKVENSEKTTLMMLGEVETASTRRHSSRYALYGRYSLGLSASETATTDTDYMLHTLQGRGVYTVSDRLRLELEETLKYGSGTNETDTYGGVLSGNFTDTTYVPGSAIQREIRPSTMYQSITKMTASWIPAPRMRVGFILSGDVLKQQDQAADILASFVNTVEYSLPSFAVGSTIRVAKRNFGDMDVTEYSGSGSATYKPNQKMSSEVRYNFSYATENESTLTHMNIFQRFKYSFFRNGGFGRKMLDLTEELSFFKTRSIDPEVLRQNDSEKRLTFGGDYYPTKYLFMSAVIRYSLLDPGDKKELFGSGGIGVRFPSLQANIDYSYGKRNGYMDNRIEKRFSANLKKQF